MYDELYEIDYHVNCKDEMMKAGIDAGFAIMQSNKDNRDFMAPRIEQALRRYRATHG